MHRPNHDLKISVIIPTYNRSKLLSYTLDSILNQDIAKTQFEVIVCDDGSTDDTALLVERYKKALNLKYTFQEDNGFRPGSARNKGISISEGDICLFIDTGIILSPNCLSQHINFYSDGNFDKCALGYVYGIYHEEKSDCELINLIDTNDVESSIQRLQKKSTYHDLRESSYQKYNDQIELLPAPWFYFWTCHVSVTAISLEKVGMFDENYDENWGMEDNDLGLRLNSTGIDILLLRNANSIHYPHSTNNLNRKVMGIKNCIYFNEKFNNSETKLFLKIFRSQSTEYIDLNDLILGEAIIES